MVRWTAISAVTAMLWCAAAGCSRSAPSEESDARLPVMVTIGPQGEFVERIGAEHVRVSVMVDAAQSPHEYQLTPRKRAALAEAEIYFRIGIPFERQLSDKIDQPGLRFVDTDADIAKLSSAAHHHDDAAGGGEPDPHVWMDPKLVRETIAPAICRALCEADPANRADYEANLRAFQVDLTALDERIAQALAPLRGRTMYVAHPAFGYFAASYGMKQEVVEIEGKSPSPKRLTELISRAKADGVKAIFVQKQFSDKAARVIASEIGGAVVVLDPLAKDYIANLERMAVQVKQALVERSDEKSHGE